MTATFYSLKSCDTCRKAEKALRSAGLALTIIDVRSDGVPKATLTQFFETFGERLINKRSTTWRALSEAERTQDPVSLLEAHPTLMKRPVIEANGQRYLGWTPEVQAELL